MSYPVGVRQGRPRRHLGPRGLKALRHRLLRPTTSKGVDKLNAGDKSHTQNLSSGTACGFPNEYFSSLE